jgi:myo-inositol-1(or 4)-monophosphatase
MKENFSPLTLTAIDAAKTASNILRKGFGTKYEIATKPGRSNFVTFYDKASEESIIHSIHKQFPSHRILAEESGYTGNPNGDEILWVIDPLDGTTNFSRHIPICCISIAALQHGKLLCGVIYQPFTDELFFAEHGKGAYLNDVRLQVSTQNTISECLVMANSPYEPSFNPTLNLQKLIDQNATFRNFGSAALGLAYVAAGKLDFLWMYNLYPWDYAAGQILIEEAGGITSLYGNEIGHWNSSSSVLGSNTALHPLAKEHIEFT